MSGRFGQRSVMSTRVARRFCLNSISSTRNSAVATDVRCSPATKVTSPWRIPRASSDEVERGRVPAGTGAELRRDGRCHAIPPPGAVDARLSQTRNVARTPSSTPSTAIHTSEPSIETSAILRVVGFAGDRTRAIVLQHGDETMTLV